MIDRKIIISNGWEPDQNNALAEVVIPSTIETLNAPRKITFLGDTLNYVPSTTAALQEIEAPNCTSMVSLTSYTNLSKINWGVTTLTATVTNGVYFPSFNKLTEVNFPELLSISCINTNGAKNVGILYSCSVLQTLTLPKLTTMISQGVNGNVASPIGSAFYNCTSLVNVSLPSLNTSTDTVNGGAFYKCTGLQTVQLGSVGHPVSSLGSYLFNGCTQSGLTITVYTNGGEALSGEPWGATNADTDIVYEVA